MSMETELNLSLTPGVASRLARHRLLSDAKPLRQRVVKTYYDTPDQRLRRERVVVGYRKQGRHWLSSVKRVSSPDGRGAERRQWEMSGTFGDLDFSHVDDGSLREWLESLRNDLRPAFTTSFTRRAWVLEPRDGVRIELALDRGWIEAEGRRQPICEVGLELLAGGVADLFSAAGELQAELALHPEPASKFQRGYGVLADQALQVVKAAPVDTDAGMTVIAGFRTIALACLRHLQSNEKGVCESDNPEFVHQARVAIRRLRSAIRVWKPRLPEAFVADYDPLWQALARQLGETRNWDVFLAETLPTIIAAFPECPQADQLASYARRRCAVNRQVAGSALSSGEYSRLLLDFTAAVLALPERENRRLDVFAPRCLDKRAGKVWQLAQEALTSDATARHRLRVAYKRLRYALEFFAPLFPGELLRNYHLSASGLQEMLGQLNDLAVARELIEEALPGAPGEGILRWLEARSDGLLPQLEGLLGDFYGQRVPWQHDS
ncbi:MAG TPA: CYTH and CHAD domain-containing protein [Accumulibacter sp.]|uniref:CYTH and CHAD domain-containing protein n=1 Tax=Accumulibacter sp. TaxID=2053492 RepID=UPI002C794E10|nr:CYTH and CHAD domain-containing protein [Accumulibacter sp.]HRD91100.1 CYTH and CHAD domain-containing protein [Accumulibacter sp.]